MDLSHNFIEILNPGDFQALWKCRSVNLMHNFIREIQDNAFQGLPSQMAGIYLSYNKLRVLRAGMWRGIKYITSLSIRYNELRVISSESFGPDLDIFTLSLEYNKIFQIAKDSFKYMTKLADLRLIDNALQWVPCFSEHMPKVANEMQSGPEVALVDNTLECQPKSCWYEPFTIWKKGNGPNDCSSLRDSDCKHPFQSLTNPWKFGKCCRSIEPRPNVNCLKNVTVINETFVTVDHSNTTQKLILGGCTLKIKEKPKAKTTAKPLPKPTANALHVTARNNPFKDIMDMINALRGSKPNLESDLIENINQLKKAKGSKSDTDIKQIRPPPTTVTLPYLATAIEEESMSFEEMADMLEMLKQVEKKRKAEKQLQNDVGQKQMICVKAMMLIQILSLLSP